MSTYLQHLRNAATSQAASVVGASPVQTTAMQRFAAANSSSEITQSGVGAVTGAVVGALVGHRRGHWALGGIAGLSIGANAPALFRPEDRKRATVNIGETLIAVVIASMSSKTPWKRGAVFVVAKILANALARVAKLRE